MGCCQQKSPNPKIDQNRYQSNANTQTQQKRQSLEVYDPIIGKMVQVPILVPAYKSSILKRRSTQMTIGQ
ncbi:unnamed protein product [Paramecium octaurelia]|uniref:Uncharacterized protein n=1 Tax=Paramecium octaurelia TaxID=43137 RepID=A0A8S1UNN4_PAROT|nr:unnamed protein product [Paramecium octaurelia]